MKVIQSLLVLTLAVSLSACPSDDDPEPSRAKVEGTYRLTFYEFTYTGLYELEGEWIADPLDQQWKAVDIDMTITFRSDGIFQPEGGYTLQSETGITTRRPHRWADGKWKIEGDKFYISDDGILAQQISYDAWTGVIRNSDEEFPIDGLNILGITDTKITLELISNMSFEWGGFPRQWKSIGTVVLEK